MVEALILPLLAFAALAAALTAVSLVFEALLNYLDRRGSSPPMAGRKRSSRPRALERLERQRQMKNVNDDSRTRCLYLA